MEFTKEYLEGLITSQVEENSQLEYKAADALGRTDKQKREMTKDISAFANSAGGVIIYGIREYADAARSHLPERLDPVDQSNFSKEWIDQITASIQPRIEGLCIVPVHVGPRLQDYCYVVTVPQSGTAHQALDLRYHRRRNFESTAMEDYEIRDVMNRRKHPTLTASIRIVDRRPRNKPLLSIQIENTSRVMARHYAVVVHTPLRLSAGAIHFDDAIVHNSKDGRSLWMFSLSNGAGDPIFPGSMTVLRKEFSYVRELIPVQGPSITDIHLTLYADDMEKIDLIKEVVVAEREWA